MPEVLRCTAPTAVFDAHGQAEAVRRIDPGDICLVGERQADGLIPVTYPVKTGTRRAFVRDRSPFTSGYRIYNQNAYGHIPYPAKGYEKATVRSGGCGVTAMAMVVENLVLGMLDPAACASIALSCGARVSGGTDLRRLGKALCSRYPMTMSVTSSVDALRACMDRGGMAVVNTGGDGPGHKGIFSSGGHYIVLLELEDAQAVVADPGYYSGKYQKAWRKEISVGKNDLLWCRLDRILADSRSRDPAFYLFERKVTA